MSAEPLPTSDVIGLTKVAPLSRRGFMTASAAVTAGYTLAAGPVRGRPAGSPEERQPLEQYRRCLRHRQESYAGFSA